MLHPTGFIDEKSCHQGWATAQASNESVIFDMRITTSVLSSFNLTTVTCGRWSFATD